MDPRELDHLPRPADGLRIPGHRDRAGTGLLDSTSWTYAAPLLSALGAISLLLGAIGAIPILLITAGSAVFCAVALRVVQLQRAVFTSVTK